MFRYHSPLFEPNYCFFYDGGDSYNSRTKTPLHPVRISKIFILGVRSEQKKVQELNQITMYYVPHLFTTNDSSICTHTLNKRYQFVAWTANDADAVLLRL